MSLAYPQRVVEQCEKSSGPKLTLIGSHVPQAASPAMRHEGYGGWTAKRFATHFTASSQTVMARTGEYAKRGSPFLYKTGTDSPRLDFAAYCRDIHAGRFPDVVSIFLGPNGIFSFDDETIDPGIDDIGHASRTRQGGRGWSRFGRSHGDRDQHDKPGHREDAPAPATPP